MAEALKHVFEGLESSRADLKRFRQDPSQSEAGQHNLKMLAAAVHSMELNAVQLLQGTPPANEAIN